MLAQGVVNYYSKVLSNILVKATVSTAHNRSKKKEGKNASINTYTINEKKKKNIRTKNIIHIMNKNWFENKILNAIFFQR